jgi:uncharacterized zinc-type alcohol dehydrogenase-like protein
MSETKAYAALVGKGPLVPHTIVRRTPGPNDVAIDILFSGICHTDVHQVSEDWGPAKFPMVPGHEIVGRVVAVGSEVKDLDVGAAVGVGCMVDSCRVCASCKDCAEQHCSACVFTYNDTFKHDHIPEKVCRVPRPLCAITLAFFSVFPAFSSRACPGQPDLRRLQSGHRR